MKIVSIGNSFSRNMQKFVHQVAEAAGQDLEVVNAYHPACTMAMHTAFLREAVPAYQKEKNGAVTAENVTLESILTSDVFDFVTLQSGTHGWREAGGIPLNYPHILELIAAVKRFQPRAELVYNHFWAASDLSRRPAFLELFGGSREKMNAWWQAEADRAAALPEIGFVMPCARAVEEAYPVFGERLYKDGYHLSAAGEYLQACLWTEFYTGARPGGYLPEKTAGEITGEEGALLREAAHRAVLSVTKTPARGSRE